MRARTHTYTRTHKRMEADTIHYIHKLIIYRSTNTHTHPI